MRSDGYAFIKRGEWREGEERERDESGSTKSLRAQSGEKLAFFFHECIYFFFTGYHECEILGSGLEAAESVSNWEKCQKNPGHEEFISAQDFIDNYLPKLKADLQRERLRARIDLTVRLRVNWTSLDRPDEDQLSKFRGKDRLRCGTGFLDDVNGPVSNKPCLCDDCDGKVTKKHWTFSVNTAQHVVYNTEEAKNTRVDFFYDDEKSHQEGRMKTAWALKVEQSSPHKDVSKLFCVTHDEALGERIKSVYSCWDDSKIHPLDLTCLNIFPSYDGKHDPALMVSHPHGQPKKITVGKATDTEHPLVKYNTPTCPGSSGAPTFLFYPHLEDIPYLNYCTPVHSGSSTANFIKNKHPPNFLKRSLQKLRVCKYTPEQKNYGYIW